MKNVGAARWAKQKFTQNINAARSLIYNFTKLSALLDG
jgi:hypothetical protein